MLLDDWLRRMEQIAPANLAEEWDNPGLLIGLEGKEVHRVLVALDCSPAVAQEAAEQGADLVLTHHPLFFHPVRHIRPEDPETAAAYRLIRHGIGLFAAHTNLDSATGGVNDALAEALGLENPSPYGSGMGRMGSLPEETALDAFAARVAEKLHTQVCYCGEPDTLLRRVAVLGGAGGDLLAEAKAAGADGFVTGEMKHHEGHAADVLELPVIVAGHYETERIVLQRLIDRLQDGQNDVQYRLARTDASPFRRLKEDMA